MSWSSNWCGNLLNNLLTIKQIRKRNPTVHYYDNNIYRFALYVYSDEPYIVYLSNVFVHKKNRGCGFGNLILIVAEQEALAMNANTLCLKCLKNSWLHDWYKKCGFEDLCLDNNFKFIWMKKDIKKLNKNN